MATEGDALGITHYLGTKKNGIPFWLTYVVFSLTLISFGAVNWIVRKYGTPRQKMDPWLWRNITVSSVHGLFVGVWSIVSLIGHLTDSPSLIEDPLLYFNTSSYFMMLVSTGYFLYDALDIAANGMLKKNKEIIIHHFAIITSFGYFWHKMTAIGYAHIFLLSETSSFLLHARKLLRLFNVRVDTIHYTLFSFLNLFAFFILRLIPMTFVVYRMWPEYFMMREHIIAYALLSLAALVIYLINIGFFFKLVQSDVIRPRIKKSS